MKVYFELEAGILSRSSIREQLNNSKSKIEHWYPGSHVLLTENKSLFDSKFYFEANNLPESAKNHMELWIDGIKSKIEEIAE